MTVIAMATMSLMCEKKNGGLRSQNRQKQEGENILRYYDKGPLKKKLVVGRRIRSVRGRGKWVSSLKGPSSTRKECPAPPWTWFGFL